MFNTTTTTTTSTIARMVEEVLAFAHANGRTWGPADLSLSWDSYLSMLTEVDLEGTLWEPILPTALALRRALEN